LKLLEGVAREYVGQQSIKIFLASSSELRAERDEFDRHFSRHDEPRLRISRWEDSLDAMSQTRLQDEYNQAVPESDIVVCLFATRAGQFTVEEFEIAFAQFQSTGRPRIFTYFKEASVNPSTADRKDLQALWDFQDRLKQLGHYQSSFKNIDDLKLQFTDQVKKLKPILSR
jgi:hypothetical protein